MDFISELKSKIGDAQQGFNEAIESGAKLKIVGALQGLVKKAVFYAEEFANGLKDYDVNFTVMTGQDKHELVLNAVLDTVVQKLNQAIDIPFIGEELEEKLFKGLINWMIKASVSYFNKKGWAL